MSTYCIFQLILLYLTWWWRYAAEICCEQNRKKNMIVRRLLYDLQKEKRRMQYYKTEPTLSYRAETWSFQEVLQLRVFESKVLSGILGHERETN
jgi:hypothetical protein